MTTLSLEERKYRHEKDMKRGSELVFHRALRKYGFENFKWRIVVRADDIEILSEAEIMSIKSLKTKIPNGYNMTDGGDNPPHGPEWSKKMSISMKGNKSAVGYIKTSEHREKLRASLMGHEVKKETRKLLREVALKQWQEIRRKQAICKRKSISLFKWEDFNEE